MTRPYVSLDIIIDNFGDESFQAIIHNDGVGKSVL